MTINICQSQGAHRDERKRLGFTIVEAVVAAALALIMFVAVFSAVSQSFSIITVTRQNLRATQIIVSRLEGVRLEAWTSSTNETAELFSTTFVPATFTDNFYPQVNNSTNLGITYYGTMSVVQLTNAATQTNVFGSTIPSYAANMALVTVTLNWTNTPSGILTKKLAHTRSMNTLVSEYGIQNYIYAH